MKLEIIVHTFRLECLKGIIRPEMQRIKISPAQQKLHFLANWMSWKKRKMVKTVCFIKPALGNNRLETEAVEPGVGKFRGKQIQH